jgi:ribonuclease E
MKKEMLINVLQPEECRIAILEDGVLEELYVERTSHESYVGNIYKGRIVNIEPSIQAAFVDFGVGRNGFLHVSDVEPAYYRHLESRREDRGRRPYGRDRFRAGDQPERFETRPAPPPRLEEVWESEEIEIAPAADLPASELPSDEEVIFSEAQITFSTQPPDTVEVETTEQEANEDEPAEGRSQDSEVDEASPKKRAARGRRGKGKGTRGRRSRGGGRRRRAAVDEKDTPSAGGAEDISSPDRLNEPPTDEERPRPMPSAERRTEEADDASGSPPPIDDDDIFFPRPHAVPPREPADTAIEEEAVEEEEVEDGTFAVDEEAPSLTDSDATGFVDEEDEVAMPSTEAPADEPDAEEMAPEPLPELDTLDDDLPRRPPPRQRDDRRGRDLRGRGGRDRGRAGLGRPKPPIQEIFRRGQEVLVQVIKEGIGTKGPTLSTYISIAGRYLVLMPGLNRVGVSRKIADDEQRRRLREIFHELQPPKGLGFIIRTAGIDKNKKELQNDLAYLSRLWQVVVRRIRKMKAPAEIYQESDMITRTIRDTFTSDIDRIVVDEPAAYEHAREFLQFVMPRFAHRIHLYAEPEPLFHKYGIEEEIVRIQQRHVPLPNGGSIVIDQTEALVAIDVNSGNFRADNNAEETAYQMNLLAAKEIARQLRLRDLGGVIANDFIDMREEKHRRAVEKAMRDAVKRDRARTKILRISQFGIIEMTRQRIRPSLKRSVYHDCPHCHGMGQVKTVESLSIEVMRLLQLAAHRANVRSIQVRVADPVANYLQNKKRREIGKLEEAGDIQVQITGVPAAPSEMLEFVCYDKNNNEIKVLPYSEEPQQRTRRR